MKSQKINLSQGRIVSYRVYGDQYGLPFFYFHGFPGSGLDVAIFNGDAIAKQHGIKLIAVDRPGYGDSDFQKERVIMDWPNDISEIADTFGIDRFSIIGYSGGGPYALACAYSIPDRLNKVCIISSMTPINAPDAKKGKSMLIPKQSDFLKRILLKGMNKMAINQPEKLFKNMYKSMLEADKKILAEENTRIAYKNTLIESMQNGYQGAKLDANLYADKWGFDLCNVRKHVYLFHGEKDLMVVNKSIKNIAGKLPDCQSVFYPDEGHISLIFNHFDEILTLLIKDNNGKRI